MKLITTLFLPLVATACCLSCTHAAPSTGIPDLASEVNPMIGASTSVGDAGVYHGLGKTFPGAATPFGMVQVSPNTITGGDNGSGYSDEHRTIEGFALTQMSGVGWYGDLGNFLVMPTVAEEGKSLQTLAGREDGTVPGWRSPYDKASEHAEAGYYSVVLNRYDVKTECTATTRCGFMRFTYPKSDVSRLQVDLARRVGGTASEEYVERVDDSTFRGWIACTPDGGGWGDGEGKARYTLFFYATLSKPADDYGFWTADIPEGWSRHREDVTSDRYLQRVAEADVVRGQQHCQGKHIGFFVEFPTKRDEAVTLKVGVSFVDMEGAQANYQAEASERSFDDARRDAYQSWNDALAKVEVEGGTDNRRKVFYTALYHTMIDPRIFNDVDGRYMGGDYAVHQGQDGWTKRTLFSGWDVFRSQMPLQCFINPRMVSDLLNSLITLADESGKGYFERWELLNAYSGCMMGNPALSVLADAWTKGIRTFDAEKALQQGIASSQTFGNYRGTEGVPGYFPGSLCISNTLEYAYADWCLGQFAHLSGQDEATADAFFKKGEAWRNIFDTEKGWFRPRTEDGAWAPWPTDARTKEWYGCMESDPWQQGWFVPQNISGMVEMMGGREAVIADLDAFFAQTPDDMHWNVYYNHANEPVHFVPFLYNRLGQPWKTQYWTRFICDHAYWNDVKGIVGNEDVGQMSAWYVLAASGLHPVCPGDGWMEITSPLFEKVTLHLDSDYHSGESFVVKATNLSDENIYIQQAFLNGEAYQPCRLPVEAITRGGTLELVMGPQPNEQWGVEAMTD